MYWSIDQSRCHDNLSWHSGEQRPLYRMHPLSNYPLARGTLPFRAPNDVCVPGCIGDRAAGVGVRDCACAAPMRPHWAAAIVRAAVPTKRRRSQLRSSDMCLSPIGYPIGVAACRAGNGHRVRHVPRLSDDRSDLHAARISAAQSSGCSPARPGSTVAQWEDASLHVCQTGTP
jgi:hypothetical protein